MALIAHGSLNMVLYCRFIMQEGHSRKTNGGFDDVALSLRNKFMMSFCDKFPCVGLFLVICEREETDMQWVSIGIIMNSHHGLSFTSTGMFQYSTVLFRPLNVEKFFCDVQ